MKKRVEAELISIAHRILKLKNKSDVDQLYKETQKLYETLSVLKFYQDNYEVLKSEVDAAEVEEKLETAFEAETPQVVVAEVKVETMVEAEAPAVEAETFAAEDAQEEPVVTEAETEVETVEEEEAEAAAEVTEIEPEVAAEPAATEAPLFTPIFELAEEEAEEEAPAAETASELKPDTKHIALEDLLGENYVDPVFVKPNEVSLFTTETKEEIVPEPEIEQPKPAASLNSAFAKTIEIGLNDRIAFVNHLFGESNEDFNRVISQLNTFDTLEEAKTFLNEMVIPDYNYWVGKEDYMERFMSVVERKFS
ncbi:MAG: hypothetical protein C0525_08510 [Flavobacterium sp.]|uniref:hypothetical protein n=1 Tax=Flavobacterium sp. TaxID=239 RepID=UPI0025C3B727|nr:hypothetical protein [Flavobacterium sp.]MBA4134753.1 hypothetical protein [Flavobacterium sp.]